MRRYAKASFAGSTLGSGTRRGRLGLICLCVLGLAAFLGSSAPSASAQACPNEEFRQGPSSFLPDCRAYELVTPVDMEGQEVSYFGNSGAPAPTASADGERVFFPTLGGFGETVVGSPASGYYLAQRGATSWTSHNVNGALNPYPFVIFANILGFNEGLDKILISPGLSAPPLAAGATEGAPNLYLRDDATGTFSLLSPGLPAMVAFEYWNEAPRPWAISADAGHVVFGAPEPLTGCTAGSFPRLCDWNAATGTLSPVAGAGATGGVHLGGENWRHPVSADGSRIFFTGGGGGCGLCVRLNGATTQVIGAGTGTFQVADANGTVAYINEGGDLKRYDVASEELTNLTGGGGEVQGALGASSDGSRVYFVAKKELAPGATAGENNLYLWTQGAGFKFIATGNTSEFFRSNWEPTAGGGFGQPISSRVTPDGMHLAFTADNSLTGFPDHEKSEAYLYSAASGALVCASCFVAPGETVSAGSYIEGGTPELQVRRLSRNLSDDGAHLFFYTEDPQVPRDSNGKNDVYEYDAASGQVALISPGNGNCGWCSGGFTANAYFGDASASGNDAFFWSRENLVPVDRDEILDVYDARVGGGIASQHASSAPPCTGDACRGESSTPSPAGVGLVGKGNLSQKQNCNKLGKEAKKLSNRAKRLRKNGKQAKRNGKSAIAKKRSKKATRLAKRARSKSKSAKKCRKRNRGASK